MDLQTLRDWVHGCNAGVLRPFSSYQPAGRWARPGVGQKARSPSLSETAAIRTSTASCSGGAPVTATLNKA